MKKIISSIVLTVYIMFLFSATGIASELYFIKNANKSVILPSVQNSFNTSGYTIKNNDPVYGVKGSNAVVAILEQSGSDTYYFIDNTIDTDLSKKIKSAINSPFAKQAITDYGSGDSAQKIIKILCNGNY